MAIPLDKEGNKRADKSSKSKYRLDDSERKLPRPVVFWSENEKDAFRRNKVVQTRYYMLLDDIETQQKSSEKSIRHEAYKFRRRYKADIACSNENGSSVDLSSISETASTKSKIKGKENGSDSGSDNETWADVPNKGVITKLRKSNVKFSASPEVIPDTSSDIIDEVKLSTDISKPKNGIKVRSQSATQDRSLKIVSNAMDNRSKSAMMKFSGLSTTCREEINNRTFSKFGEQSNRKEINKPNSIFFDRSQAAYQLRKELQRLAKVRQTSVVKVSYTMEDAIRDERDRLVESGKKVAEYIQKLEIDKQNMKINEWTSKTIEPLIT